MILHRIIIWQPTQPICQNPTRSDRTAYHNMARRMPTLRVTFEACSLLPAAESPDDSLPSLSRSEGRGVLIKV